MMQAAKPVEGRKDDKGKRRWSLLPWRSLAVVVDVLMFGAQQYADHNWQKVERPRERYSDALQRHFFDWRMGVKVDPDSGLPTLGHMACDALFLLAFDIGFDPKLDTEES
jgi:hypothetical protein